ncbi:MAG: branched-chain amino acid ABC transporter permease [Acidocella sp.]|nr:branched-chain amino acid ABC transporter permease [Acidocella sp.]MDR3719420.1 branched-chain amino acid ABC transporter permease [Bryobacteraceae bacterium]
MIQNSSRLSQRASFVLLLGLIVFAASMPWWARRYTEQWTIEFLYTLALAQGWNLLAGYGGLLSVGQQAFVGIGGYLLVMLGVNAGLNPFVIIPIAGLVCAVLAVPMAGLLFRLRGANFAVGTWVVAEVLRLLIANDDSLGGGSGTSITPTLMGIPVWWRLSGTLWIALALGAGGTLVVYALLRSKLGLALTAVRDSEPAAASLGVSVRRIKWIVYLAAACWAGMTGALIFITKLRIAPDAAFSIDWTTTIFFVVVIGGIGTIEGPILGTLAFFVLRGLLADYGSWYLVALGAVAVVFMVWIPSGLWGMISRGTGLRLFPVQRRAPSA